jgi:hypothetical protein
VPENVSCIWLPVGKYHAVHGDSKSFSVGTYVVETMGSSDGRYYARLRGAGLERTTTEIIPLNSMPSMAEVPASLKEKPNAIYLWAFLVTLMNNSFPSQLLLVWPLFHALKSHL